MKSSVLIIAGLSLVMGIFLGVSSVLELEKFWSPAAAHVPSLASENFAPASTIQATGSRTSTDSNASAMESVEAIFDEPDLAARTQKLDAYAQSVSIADIPKAMAEISAKTSPQEESSALAVLASRWVKADPDGARAGIGALSDRRSQYVLTEAVFEPLARIDATNAQQLARQMPAPELQAVANAVVLHAVAAQNPAAALARFNADPNQNLANLGGIFSAWATTDLDQATKAGLGLPHEMQRKTAIQIITMQLAQKDPAKALAWMDSLPLAMTEPRMRESLVSHWAHSDPQAAAAYVRDVQRDAPELVPGLAQAVMSQWAMTDPHAATAWAQGLPAEAKTDALKMGLMAWSSRDPKGAAAYLNSAGLDPDNAAPQAATIASTWAKSDPQAALTWVGQLPAGPMASEALSSVLNQWATKDPAKAAGYLTNLPDGPSRWNAISQIGIAWASDDAPAAAQWAATLPDSRVKLDLFGSLAGIWAHNDPEKASAWLTQLPNGPNRDYAVSAFSKSAFHTDPGAALQWANSISDPDLRAQQVTSLLQKWIETDPAKGTAAVQQSSLSPDQKAELLGTSSPNSSG